MQQEDILFEEERYLPQADNGLRFANLLIDTLIYYVIVFSISAIIGIIMFTANEELANQIFMTEEESLVVNLVSYIIAFTIMFLYYFVAESTTQRTVGKFITGTIVVTESGDKPAAKQIAIRSLTRLIPFEAFSFLGNNGWHDKWSNTFVVKKKDLTMNT